MSNDPSQKILIHCPQCGRQLNVPAAALGKTGKCPGCQHMFPLQQSAPASTAAPPVIRQPTATAAPEAPLGGADPFGELSGYEQGAQPTGQSPLGAPQQQFGAPQQQFGAPQQFGQQQPAGFQSAPAFQQPNPAQWSPNNPYSAPVTEQAKKRKAHDSEEGTPMGMIGGGLLMMIGAVVWFGLGLVGGVIFFYPPILFIVGLISLIGGVVKLGQG